MYQFNHSKFLNKFDAALARNLNLPIDDLEIILRQYQFSITRNLLGNCHINGPLFPLIILTQAVLNLACLDQDSCLTLKQNKKYFYFELTYYDEICPLVNSFDEFIKNFISKYKSSVMTSYSVKKSKLKNRPFQVFVMFKVSLDELNTYKEYQ